MASGNEKMKETRVKRGLRNIENEVPKHEVVVISRPFVSPQKRCDRCAQPSGMITPDEAAALFEVSTRTIYGWLESGAIHFSETAGEGMLICLSTLAATNTLAGDRTF
jgi:excisionase family DNA binding protein